MRKNQVVLYCQFFFSPGIDLSDFFPRRAFLVQIRREKIGGTYSSNTFSSGTYFICRNLKPLRRRHGPAGGRGQFDHRAPGGGMGWGSLLIVVPK